MRLIIAEKIGRTTLLESLVIQTMRHGTTVSIRTNEGRQYDFNLSDIEKVYTSEEDLSFLHILLPETPKSSTVERTVYTWGDPVEAHSDYP